MRPEADGERISFTLEVDYFPGWTTTPNKVEALLQWDGNEQLIVVPNLPVLFRRVDEIVTGRTLA